MSTVDGVAAKYFMSYLGWLLIADPFLEAGAGAGAGAKEESRLHLNSVARYEHYHIVARLMVNLSSAVGSLVLSGRDVVRCLGMGWRLADFAETLSLTAAREATEKKEDAATALELAAPNIRSTSSEEEEKEKHRNELFWIDLYDVSVASPSARDVPLLSSLSLQLRQGSNTIITGPNGSGKSSLLRVLAGMWRPQHGR